MRAIDADALMEILTTAIRNMEGVAEFIGAEDDPEIRMEIKAYTDIANGVKDMPTIKQGPDWIPVMDGDGEMPSVDEEGYSDWVMISFTNMNQLVIGQYRVDDDGGAFYEGDDEEPLSRFGLIVNAWMPVPEPYREED